MIVAGYCFLPPCLGGAQRMAWLQRLREPMALAPTRPHESASDIQTLGRMAPVLLYGFVGGRGIPKVHQP